MVIKKKSQENSYNAPKTISDKRTYSVTEIQEILGIGKNQAYSLVKSNEFKTVRIGNTIRISKKSFDKWLDC